MQKYKKNILSLGSICKKKTAQVSGLFFVEKITKFLQP